jgi:cardiolipin synthase (CMP-forming)
VHRWLRQVPNLISSLRIVLVIPIALTLVHGQFAATIGLFGAAAVSDAADGFLAKRFGWQSTLGGILDPVADKLLLATTLVVLAALRLVPLWFMAAAVARDIVVVLGAIAYRLYVGPIQAQPSAVSKLNMLCEAAFIFAVIGREQFSIPPAWVVVLLGALTFMTVMISGIDYVLRYGRSAWNESRSRRGIWRAGGSKLT